MDCEQCIWRAASGETIVQTAVGRYPVVFDAKLLLVFFIVLNLFSEKDGHSRKVRVGPGRLWMVKSLHGDSGGGDL